MTDSHNINVAVFVSGNGTNCENLIRFFAHHSTIHIALVLTTNGGARALERARRLGVPTEVLTPAQFDDAGTLLPVLDGYNIGFIVLAGFLRMIPRWLVEKYNHRMVNLHPALLPKFGGKGMYGHHVHEAVKAAGETETGMTVHWVNADYDKGDIIAQRTTALSPDDTPDDIAAKEHVLEMEYFPKIVEEAIESVFGK